VIDTVAVLGPGRIGRQIALACALAGCRVLLADLKPRPAGERRAVFADVRRELARDLRLMAEEELVKPSDLASVLDRIEEREGLDGLEQCGFVQEALPESLALKREVLGRVSGRAAPGAVIASASSTISPRHLASTVTGPERFLVAHWLNPAHVIPLVEVVPGAATAPAVVERTLAFLERLGKTPVRCGDAPGFIGSRIQVLLMNEAVRLVEEGVAAPEEVDRAILAGLGFRYAAVGVFEFIDWGGVDVLDRASRFMAEARGDARYAPARLVQEKVARGELGPKTGRGFFDYAGARREAFETEKLRALLRQLRQRAAGRAGEERRYAVADYFARRYGERRSDRLSASARLRGTLFSRWVGAGKRVLDVGCGAGTVLRFLVPGNRVTGVDADREALAWCREQFGVETVWADFTTRLPFEAASFDVVVAGETIEHLPYPALLLEEVRRVLVPGGLFLGSVPNAYRLANRLEALRGRPLDREPTHLHHFSLASLRAALAAHFAVEEIVPVRGRWSGVSPSLFAHYFAWRCRNDRHD